MAADTRDLDWVHRNVLPPMWRTPDAAEELRTCVCQAPPSDWLGGITTPAARVWDRDGRTVAWPDGRGLVQVWETGRSCRRRTLRSAAELPAVEPPQ
jgi:hypothetical protein